MKVSSIRRIGICSGLPRQRRKSGTVSCDGTMRAVSLCRLQREKPELRHSATALQFPLGLANTQESDLKLSFHGADRSVTGSCHLVECAGKRILIDCGLRQGSRELDEENAGPFGFDAAAIDFVLLTHAHLDHCGRLPLLAKRGFRGEIIATMATQELARLVMLDAAHLQEEEARSDQHRPRNGAGNKPAEPLYTSADALKSLESFKRSAQYGEPID